MLVTARTPKTGRSRCRRDENGICSYLALVGAGGSESGVGSMPHAPWGGGGAGPPVEEEAQDVDRGGDVDLALVARVRGVGQTGVAPPVKRKLRIAIPSERSRAPSAFASPRRNFRSPGAALPRPRGRSRKRRGTRSRPTPPSRGTRRSHGESLAVGERPGRSRPAGPPPRSRHPLRVSLDHVPGLARGVVLPGQVHAGGDGFAWRPLGAGSPNVFVLPPAGADGAEGPASPSAATV